MGTVGEAPDGRTDLTLSTIARTSVFVPGALALRPSEAARHLINLIFEPELGRLARVLVELA